MTQMEQNEPEAFLGTLEVMAHYIQRNLRGKGKDRLESESASCS